MHTIISRAGDIDWQEQRSFVKSVMSGSACLDDMACPTGGALSLYRDREGLYAVVFAAQGYLRASVTDAADEAKELFAFLKLIHTA